MITVPDSARVKRNKEAERLLAAKARAWIEGEERSTGIHASDLMDLRQAFFSRTSPKPLPARLINTFLVGKVLHAFVLGAVSDAGSQNLDLRLTDTGSRESDELGIVFSPDAVFDGIVRELKTSRSFYEPKDQKDLALYMEQLLIYMAATNTLESELWILFLNFRDEKGKTAPAFRGYTLTVSQEDLDRLKIEIKETRAKLELAIQSNDVHALPLCREWKCGRNNCDWYDECRPEGRFGDPTFDNLPRPKKASDERSSKAKAVRGKSVRRGTRKA